MQIGVKLAEILGADPLGYEVVYRIHATQRMFQRQIREIEVIEVLRNGEVIEEYGEDLPFPSLLLNARTGTGRNVHVVVAFDTQAHRLYIITVYDPDQAKWTNDFTKRKVSK